MAKKHHSVLFALTDGSPGDADTPSAVNISLNSDDGAFMIAEYQYKHSGHTWLFGAWQYTQSEAFKTPESTQTPVSKQSGNWGAYIRHEHSLIKDRLSGFIRLGISDSEFNKYQGFASAGIVLKGILPSRPEDSIGLAMAYTDLSTDFSQSAPLQQERYAQGELNVEMTYRAALGPHAWIQPMIQYIDHPAAIQQDSALVVGLRVSLAYE